MTSPTPTPAAVRRIRFRRAWAEDWNLINPILADGEPGFDRTNNMLKVGDGVTPWVELSYLTPPEGGPGSTEGPVLSGDVDLDAYMLMHIKSPAPHPVYDDGPSLVLIYQNAKV